MTAASWQRFTYEEQMGNVGMDVYRAIKCFKAKDDKCLQQYYDMSLELFEFTLNDPRWDEAQRGEILRSREWFCKLMKESDKMDNLEKELDSLDDYFLQIALIARKDR